MGIYSLESVAKCQRYCCIELVEQLFIEGNIDFSIVRIVNRYSKYRVKMIGEG